MVIFVRILEMSTDELIDIVANNEIIGLGSYGILYKLDEDTICIDAYSGAGLLTAMLAKKSYKAIGIEIIKEAVENANDCLVVKVNLKNTCYETVVKRVDIKALAHIVNNIPDCFLHTNISSVFIDILTRSIVYFRRFNNSGFFVCQKIHLRRFCDKT